MTKKNIKKAPFNILALSGGGIRGIFTIQILAQLEEYLAEENQEPDYNISQHFDLICGTSIGGIFAIGLSFGLNARELLKIIDKNRLVIFPKKSKLIRKFNQAVSGIYKQAPLKNILVEMFADKIIGELNTRLLIPSVNYSTGKVQVFKTPHHEDFKQDWRYQLTDIALATSAAPTYFPVHEFNNSWYVDGGLAANSPSLMGVHEATHFLKQSYESINLLTIGTMGAQQTANQEKSKEKGYIKGWALGDKLIDLTLSANEGLHNMIASHLLPDENYLIIDDCQTPDQAEVLSLDNASDGAASVLKAKGKQKAQSIVNNAIYKKIISHKAPTPNFLYGPKVKSK